MRTKCQTNRVAALAGLCLFLNFLSTSAQESAAQRQQMATNQLKQIAAEMTGRCLSEVKTLDDWKSERVELRRQLLDMLGLDPLPARTPLRAEITGRIDRGAYHIEKIVFQSLPGLYVTGNFYVPKEAAQALPTILYLCGHSPSAQGAKVEYQDRAAWFASHGFPILVLDTLEFGEVAGIHHGTHNLNMWQWLSLGYTPAGVEVWNAIRALDYLESRPEVDKRRIGLTGISGGGAMTWYTAAVDERIAVAAPVCSTFTFGSQAAHWIASGQCDCIYYHNTYGWDFPVLGALIAPRPLLMLSGQKDTIFPPDGYHAVFQRSKRIFDLYAPGDSDRVREVDADVPHSDPPLFLQEARQWMQRWLKNDANPIALESSPAPFEKPEDLACLTNLPSDAINFKIHHQFIATPLWTKPDSRAAWERRRFALVSQLKEKVFRWFPTNTIPFETRVSRDSSGLVSRYADYKDVSFQTETGARVRARLISPKSHSIESPLLIYVKRAGDSIYANDMDELLPVFGRWAVLILNPRFTEQSMNPAEYTDVERTAAWVGRTIAGMQIWDIERAIHWALDEEGLRPRSVTLYGKGDMGILGLYAALSEDRITQVILNDPPASHWQRPALLNVLRVTDVAEVAGAFAPRRLVSLTKLPEEFEITHEIYNLQRAPGEMRLSGSLPEALDLWKSEAGIKN